MKLILNCQKLKLIKTKDMLSQHMAQKDKMVTKNWLLWIGNFSIPLNMEVRFHRQILVSEKLGNLHHRKLSIRIHYRTYLRCLTRNKIELKTTWVTWLHKNSCLPIIQNQAVLYQIHIWAFNNNHVN